MRACLVAPRLAKAFRPAAILWLISLAGAAVAVEPPRPDCPSALAVSEGVFLIGGTGGTPSRANRGRVANTAILVGRTGVIVVDPGPTRRSGQAVACTVRRLTRLPVVALINTHPHPENVLGNIAFGSQPIFAATDAAMAMGARCGHCQERLARALGRKTMRGTRAIIPDRRVSEAIDITLGGRSLRLLPLGNAHSPGDLTIVDKSTGTLIGGDVVTLSELPDLRDGTLRGWIGAIERLQSLPQLQRILPGRGAPFGPERLSLPLDYLRELHAAAKLAADSGEWPPRIARESEFAARFSRFAELHPLNLQHALREAEDDWLSEPRDHPQDLGQTKSPSTGN